MPLSQYLEDRGRRISVSCRQNTLQNEHKMDHCGQGCRESYPAQSLSLGLEAEIKAKMKNGLWESLATKEAVYGVPVYNVFSGCLYRI